MLYAFMLLCLTFAVLVLLLLVLKNSVLLSAHLTNHAGAFWIDLMAFQAFSLLLLPLNPFKLVLFKFQGNKFQSVVKIL